MWFSQATIAFWYNRVVKQKAVEFLKKPLNRDVIINTIGNYLNVFFVAFFALILVRIMTPSQYGVLSVLLGIAYVLANILDFGTTATIYSYLPPLIEEHSKQKKLYQFIKTTFFYQSTLSFIVIGILLLSFPYLDKVFFKTGAPKLVLYLTSISVLFFIWQNFILNILFSAKKFFKANLYLNIANVLKTLLIFFLILDGVISVGTVIFVFGIVGPAIFFFLLFLEKRDLVFVLLRSDVKREEFRFGYTLTYFFATQFFNLGLRMDLFLLSFFGLRNEVGYYGLAQKIMLTIVTTAISITQVLSPNFATIKLKEEVRVFLKTAFFYLLIPLGLYILLFLTPNWAFNIFFTDKFSYTAPVAKSLIIPYMLFTIGNLPVLFILYTFKKPVYILISNIIFFFSMTIGSYLLIPTLGVFAPSYVITFSILVPILIQTAASIHEYKKLPA